MYKILFIESGSGFGGSARSLERTIKQLDRKRFCPLVLCYGVGPPIQRIESSGCKIIKHKAFEFGRYRINGVPDKDRDTMNGAMHDLLFIGFLLINCALALLHLAGTILKYRIEIIHLNNGIYENLPGLLASIIWKIPCVCHIRGTVPITRLERFFAGWVSKYITLNAEMYSLYRSAAGPDKAELIYNGLDLENYAYKNNRPFILHEFGIAQDDILVGSIGRVSRGKGFEDFIRAASIVLQYKPQCRFLIIGDDPLGSGALKEISLLAEELSISGRVLFTGWREDAPKIISGLDLVVQAATFPEGLPTVIMEAMALRKPVVASHIAGHTELVRDGRSGLLVPPGDPHSLAQAIIKILDDRELSKRMGECGRQIIESSFTSSITVTKIEAVYDEILSPPETRSRVHLAAC